MVLELCERDVSCKATTGGLRWMFDLPWVAPRSFTVIMLGASLLSIRHPLPPSLLVGAAAVPEQAKRTKNNEIWATDMFGFVVTVVIFINDDSARWVLFTRYRARFQIGRAHV